MIGKTLGHYQITEKLGEGGMGVVYKARDTHLDRFAAIKVLPPERVSDPERKRRFIQEAKAASALNHPSIITIYDIDQAEGVDFIAMEYVAGKTLDELIPRKGMRLSLALKYAVQIADALARAHGAGIIHRDLKPSNVMVDEHGLVKVLDFGLAKLTETTGPDAETAATTTGAGMVLGTAAYMSPEQAEGKSVDARSDVFSLGSVLYEMLTGRKAFGRDSQMKTLAAVLTEEPKPASSVAEALPAELERVLNRCLRKDSQRRWQTMSDLKVALQELEEDSESGRLKAAARAPARGRQRALALAAAALALLAAAAVILKIVVLGPKKPVEYEIIPVTFDSGMTSGPTVSPDGSLLAYGSDREGNGNLDVWIQQVSGGKPLRLTNHPADDWLPSFSPDGSQIAFRSERDGGGIYLIDALAVGGEPRRIADKGFVPNFSPDGRWIAYVAMSASLDPRQYKAYVVSPKGGEPRQVLNSFRLGFVPHGAPLVWSPDARSLLFAGRRVEDRGSTDWWVAPIDGGNPVRTHAIENLGFTTIVRFPVGWIGTNVYYISGTTIEGVNLFRASIDPKTLAITGPAEAITTGPGMKAYLSVMPDGRIFFSELTVAMNAWSVAARADEGVVTGKPQKLTQDVMQNFTPTISRDGIRAAFTAFGGAQAARIEIRVKDLTTGEETKIPVQGISLNQNPRLSPDGSFLAYLDSVEGKTRTFLVAPGVSAPRAICEGCDVLGFFPGNDSVLVQFKTAELERMDLRTGERKVLLSLARETNQDAGLSPDGRWIAWLGGEPDGRAAVRIGPAAPRSKEEGVITVAEANYYLGQPAWSPNGRWLYYLSEKNGRCSLFVRELDPRTQVPVGKEREVLVTTPSRLFMNFPKGNGQIGVAADRIIFEGTVVVGNIYLAKPRKR